MKTVRGDLVKLALEGEFDIIVHGCNCFCRMGSGIAPHIADTFDGPMGPRQVDNLTEAGDPDKLGTYSIATFKREDGTSLVIINAYTQFDVAQYPGDVVVNYDAVRSVFRNLASTLRHFEYASPPRIGYPAIGCGLAGGNWETVSNIIEEELEGLDHTFVEYDGG